MSAATQVKPDIASGITAQGKYVLGADGSAYGFNNNRSTERLGNMLDEALKKFRANPPARTDIPPSQGHTTGLEWPKDVSVVRTFTRVRPLPEGCDPMNENAARDHLWILPQEAATLAKHEFPDSLATRICRFSLVDNVRGEPDHWKPEEIEMSAFWPSGEGEFTGIFSMKTRDGSRGIQGTLAIEASLQDGKLARFQAYGSAVAWGRSTFTPGEPTGRFPLVFAFVLAEDEMARQVAPQAVFYGKEYLGR